MESTSFIEENNNINININDNTPDALTTVRNKPKSSNNRSTLSKFAESTAVNIVGAVGYLSILLFAYSAALRMVDAENDIKYYSSGVENFSINKFVNLFLRNGLMTLWGAGGAILSSNIANDGFFARKLKQIHKYFYKNASRGKMLGMKAISKILSSSQLALTSIYFMQNITFEYFGDDSTSRAFQLTMGTFWATVTQITWASTIQAGLKKILPWETPFLQVSIDNNIYIVNNPKFKGHNAIQNNITLEEDVSTEIWLRIEDKIKKGHFIPVDGKRGIIDNYYDKKSIIVRAAIGSIMLGISVTAGYLWRMIPDNRSFFNLLLSSSLGAMDDLFSAANGLIALFHPIIIQKFVRFLHGTEAFSNNGRISSIKKKIVSTLFNFSILAVTYNLAMFTHGWYQAFASRIFSIRILPENFFNPNIGNATINGTMNNSMIDYSSYYPVSPENFLINDTINKSFADLLFGVANLFGACWFYNCFQGLMDLQNFPGMKFRKLSPRAKAIICNAIFSCLVVASCVIPAERMSPIISHIIDSLAGTFFVLSCRFTFENSLQNREEQENNQIDNSNIDYVLEENANLRVRSTYDPISWSNEPTISKKHGNNNTRRGRNRARHESNSTNSTYFDGDSSNFRLSRVSQNISNSIAEEDTPTTNSTNSTNPMNSQTNNERVNTSTNLSINAIVRNNNNDARNLDANEAVNNNERVKTSKSKSSKKNRSYAIKDSNSSMANAMHITREDYRDSKIYRDSKMSKNLVYDEHISTDTRNPISEISGV